MAVQRRDGLRHNEFGIDAGKFVGQSGEVRMWRHHAVLQCQHRLDQPEGPSGRLGIAEVGRRRSERAGAVDAVDLCQAGVFVDVVGGDAGATVLDHPDRAGLNSGHRQCFSVCRSPAVLTGGGAPDHGQYPVTVANGVGEAFEQHHGGALTEHRTVGIRVEGAAASRR
jgi:hypothetical protein